MKKYTNKSKIFRTIKDKDNTFVQLPSYFFKGDYNYIEISILAYLSSNSDSFIIHKDFVRKQLQIPKGKFETSWKELENKGHIFGQREFGGWKWVYSEKSFKQGTLPTDGICVKKSSDMDKDNTLPTDRFSTDRLSTDRQLLINKEMINKETTLDSRSKEQNSKKVECIQNGTSLREQAHSISAPVSNTLKNIDYFSEGYSINSKELVTDFNFTTFNADDIEY